MGQLHMSGSHPLGVWDEAVMGEKEHLWPKQTGVCSDKGLNPERGTRLVDPHCGALQALQGDLTSESRGSFPGLLCQDCHHQLGPPRLSARH